MEPDVKKKQPEQRLLTLKACSILMGRSIYSLRLLIWERQLPVVKTGRKYWIDRADVEAWILKNKTFL